MMAPQKMNKIRINELSEYELVLAGSRFPKNSRKVLTCVRIKGMIVTGTGNRSFRDTVELRKMKYLVSHWWRLSFL